MMCADYDNIYSDPTDKTKYGDLNPDGSFWNTVNAKSDIYLTIIFTVEMCVKVVAMGFVGERGTYLDDNWNVLDFIVVITAWIPILKLDLGFNLGVIRTFRVLRPLKSVNSLPELQKIIISMLKAIPALMSVLVLLMFTYMVMGILGMQLFSGKMHQRCRLTPFPVTADWEPGFDFLEYACLTPNSNIMGKFDPTSIDSVREHNIDLKDADSKYQSKTDSPWNGGHHKSCKWPVDDEDGYMCLMEEPDKYDPLSWQCYHGESTEDWRWCGSNFDAYGNLRFKGDKDLPYFDKALYGEDFFWGYINFDSLPRAVLTIFQCVTMEGWSDVMYTAMDSKGYVTAYIYFFVLMLLGSFFALNLLLAVLEESFDHSSPPPVITLRKHKGMYQQYMGTYVKAPKDGLPRKDMEDPDRKVHGAVLYVKEGPGDKKYYIYNSKVTGKWNMVDNEADIHKNECTFKSNRPSDLPFNSNPPRPEWASAGDPKVSLPFDLPYDFYDPQKNVFVADMFLEVLIEDENTANAALLNARADYLEAIRLKERLDVDDLLKTFDTYRCLADEDQRKLLTRLINKELRAVFDSIMELKEPDEKLEQLRVLLVKAQNMDDSSLEELCQARIDLLDPPPPPPELDLTPFQAMRLKYADYVEDENGKFSMLITAFIVFNTIVLGMDRYPASPDYESALNILNNILSYIFAFEAVLKICLLGWKRYKKDNFNLFDLVVVLLSFIEDIPFMKQLGSSAFTVLRSFRLFRVFKLARKWKAMHRLLALIVSTMIDVSNFLLLVILFIFIYSMVGVQFFANRMRFDDEGYAIPIGRESPRTGQKWEDTMRPELGGVEVPRANFDTTLNAFVTVYQVLSGENWNAIMYDGWRATNDLAPWYFISLTVFGAMIVMNLFLAILLSNFGQLNDDDMDGEEEEEEEYTDEEDIIGDGGSGGAKIREEIEVEEKTAKKNLVAAKSSKKSVTDLKGLSTGLKKTMPTVAQSLCGSLGWCGDFVGSWSIRKKDVAKFVRERTQARIDLINTHEQAGTEPETDSIFPLYQGKALNMFGPDNYLRQILALVVDHPVCDNIVTFLIIISTVFLILDTPFLNPDGDLKKFLTAMDYVMTVLFTMEMVAKMIAMGLVTHKDAYLRNNWNKLDFVVVLVSIVSLTPYGAQITWFRSIRTMRTLRPLRMISRNPALKLIVDVIIESAPGIFRVTLVLALMFLIMAIFCVSFFKGKLKTCGGDIYDDVIAPSETLYNFLERPKAWNKMTSAEKQFFGPSSEAFSDDAKAANFYTANAASWTESAGPLCKIWQKPKEEITIDHPEYYGLRERAGVLPSDTNWKFDWVKDKPTSRVVCECWGGEWINMAWQDFDNVFNSLLTLFEISTTEGWVDVMWAAVDSRGIDMQPVRDIYEGWTWFFMFFIFIGNYLFLNLFVGVTIDNFSDIKKRKEEKGVSMFKTNAQKLWWETYEMSIRMNPKPQPLEPQEAWRKVFYKFVMTAPYASWLENFIMFCIIINTIIMAGSVFGEEPWWTATCAAFNTAFMIIFNLEMLAKIAAKGQMYFADQGDQFDFVIVFFTDVGFLLQFTSSNEGLGPLASIIRTFRIGRALRLVNTDNQMARDIRRLGMVLIKTLPGVLNITCLLLLLFIIFSVVGVQLFGKVHLIDDHDDHTNFRDFFKTFIVLFRFSTGENWNGFMHAVATYGTASSAGAFTGSTPEESECIESSDMDYDAALCWFNPGWDCEPLNGCGNSAIILYMVIFNFAVAFMFVNLFVGVILDGFEAPNEHDTMVEDDMEHFKKVWTYQEFDPRATCFMSVDKLPEFTRRLICFAPDSTSYKLLREHHHLKARVSAKNVNHKKLDRLLDTIHTGKTPINLYDGNQVYFKNVLMAFESHYVALVSFFLPPHSPCLS